MSSNKANRTIGALARQAGVGVETVRYYQRRGLLHEPERPHGGIRRYAESDLRRLRFIRHARGLGFSLDEAGELLRLDDGVECAQAQRIAGEKLDRIQQRIEQLQSIQTALEALLEQCRETNTARCPMIRSLEQAGRGELNPAISKKPG
ncbi:MAG: MerR family transcriptional regulator [Xanthomonadaceae bacterium]|nr:MerR family transcriptional regulator [Xanthomonadaceae bacterium]